MMASVRRLVLVVGVLLSGLQGATTQPANNSCIALYGEYGDLVAQLNSQNTEQLCSWLPDNLCDTVGLLLLALASSDGPSPCFPKAQVEPQGPLAPFEDLRPLPAELPSSGDLVESEGATYVRLFQHVVNMALYSRCATAGNVEEQLLSPPGWRLHSVQNISQGAGAPPSPLSSVLVNAGERQLVMALRGVSGLYEWRLNFAYNQTDELADVFGGPIHWGYATVFQQVWPGLQDALDQVIVKSEGGEPWQVFVVGQSMGGGMGTLVSYATQDYLNQQMGSAAPNISALLIAPTNPAGPEFVPKFNSLVNARRLVFGADVIPQALCTPSMPSCSEQAIAPSNALLAAFLVPTSMPGNTSSWEYGEVGGTITMLPEQMPQDGPSWEALSMLDMCNFLPFFSASHFCAYSCWLSQFEGAPSNATGCWLSAQPQGAPGSQCVGWPVPYPGVAGEA